MSDLIDPPSGPAEETGEKKRPHLRLVVSNPDPLPVQEEPLPLFASPQKTEFTTAVRPKGINLYEMTVEEPSHYLTCDLLLEVEESRDGIEEGAVICHFPVIDDEHFNEFVGEDETLYGMLMVQFHMKVMEQLLLFCGNHAVERLVIFVDDTQADSLGIYQDFLVYEGQAPTLCGEKTEMHVLTHTEIYDHWIDFMEETTLKLEQGLWREQRFNPFIRAYLRSRLPL